jgi:hypothetical protein
VVLWLNGPFGVGKSSAVTEFRRRDPQARSFDPERWGWVLQRTVGLVRPGDFQDRRAWRTGTIRGVARRSRSTQLLLVPMTLLEPEYTDEILDGIRSRGRQVLHVTLHASSPALRKRIEHDEHDPGALGWRLEQLPRYEAAAAELAQRGPVIDTDQLGHADVASALETLLATPR